MAYLGIERDAQAEDRIAAAVGVEAAVADVLAMTLGKKGTKPKSMANYINHMKGEGDGTDARSGDSADMSEFRRRVSALVKSGQVK